ncbi:MAG TPA: ATP-binding protein [Beijerinckiaceae bacterium]|jgi:PAS domain S-box-containing protein
MRLFAAALRRLADRLSPVTAGTADWADALPHSIWVTAPDGTALFANRPMRAYHGRDCPTLEERFALIHPDDRAAAIARRAEAFALGVPFSFELRLLGHDGAYRRHAITMAPVHRGDQITHWVGASIDVENARLAEEASRESEARLSAVAESLPALIWICAADGRTLHQNSRMAAYAGRELPDLEARRSIVHPDDLGALEGRTERLRAGEPQVSEARLRRFDGVYRWHRIAGVPLPSFGEGAWLTTATDIEDLKRAEALQDDLNQLLSERVASATDQLAAEVEVRRRVQERLAETQRLEAMGRLTGGVAHDLNNKLQVIGSTVDLLAKRLKGEPELQRRLLNVLVAADQAGSLVGRLLAFARRRAPVREVIDVGQHLHAISDLLERALLAQSVEVKLSIEGELWPIEADPGQLETAVVNLVLNARDAMPKGGTITIEAANGRAWEAPTAEARLAGDCVRITARDTGSGIAPDIQGQVFEPFFTTKDPSDASGLGLSQVQSFVHRQGGAVDLRSAPGQGTQITLFLPRAAAQARIGGPSRDADMIDEPRVPDRHGRVLVVDDDPEVAAALSLVLGEIGYEADVALGPEAALAAIEARAPDLVLTDLAMPGGMDGAALAREIRRQRPGLPVLVITGDPRGAAEIGDVPFVLKPITGRKLSEAIQGQFGDAASADIVPLFGERARR